jgi:cytochrome c oxidase assembly factor CtaG
VGAFVSEPVGNLLRAWEFEPSVVGGCAVLLVLYAVAHRDDPGRAGWFVAGVAAIFLALVSPLDVLSDTYLFSAHMAQHLMLVLVAPPLLIAGLSPRMIRRAMKTAAVGRIERVLGNAIVAWTIGMATLWIWHAPSLYNAALDDEDLHIVEHLCFLISATIYWWPIVSPAEELRMSAMPAVMYLATGAVANSVLAILLTFARPGLYPAYLDPPDPLGILPMVRAQWGLTPAADQQLGGLLMWIPGGMVFMGAVVWVIARWYAAGDREIHGIAPAG